MFQLKEQQRRRVARATHRSRIGELFGHREFSPDLLEIELSRALEFRKLDASIEYDLEVIIKSDALRGTRQRLTLRDLSWETWMDQVEPTIEAEHWKFVHKNLEVTVECTTHYEDPKAIESAQDADADEMPSPRARRTRTTRLEAQAERRRDTNEAAGSKSAEIVDKWLCLSDNCINQGGYCWVDSEELHYNLNALQRQAWADAWAGNRQGACLECPHHPLVKHLMVKQGPVTKDVKHSKKPTAKDRMDRYFELMERQQEMQMMTTMNNSLATSQSQAPVQPPIQYYTPPSALPLPPPPPYMYGYPPHPHPHPQPMSSGGRSRLSSPTSPRDSSPIDPNDDAHVIEDYWDWKIKNAKSVNERQLLLNARAKIEAQLWNTVDDYKQLSISTSTIYKQAMNLEIPHGLATKMADDIHNFKAVYRLSYKPAREILEFRGGEGGRYGGGSEGTGGGFIE